MKKVIIRHKDENFFEILVDEQEPFYRHLREEHELEIEEVSPPVEEDIRFPSLLTFCLGMLVGALFTLGIS